MMSDQYEVVWTGATHKTLPQPEIGRLVGQSPKAKGAAQTRGRILAVLGPQWKSAQAIAVQAKHARTTTQEHLDRLVRDGEVEKLKVGGNGHGYQMLYRRNGSA